MDRNDPSPDGVLRLEPSRAMDLAAAKKKTGGLHLVVGHLLVLFLLEYSILPLRLSRNREVPINKLWQFVLRYNKM